MKWLVQSQDFVSRSKQFIGFLIVLFSQFKSANFMLRNPCIENRDLRARIRNPHVGIRNERKTTGIHWMESGIRLCLGFRKMGQINNVYGDVKPT